MGIIKVIKLDVFILLGYWKHTEESLLFLHTLPRENWFQYVRREYATAINFPCIRALSVYPVCGWADISVWKHWFLIIVVAVLTSCITLEYFTGLPTKNKKVKTMLNYSNMTFSRLFLVFCYGYSNFIVLLKWLGKERNTFTVPGNPKYKETYIYSSRES